MRIDKFLKVSRLIKRRTLAKEVASQGRITVNGNKAKAGTELSPGDEVTIYFGTKTLKIKVEELHDTTKKDAASSMYTVLEESGPAETSS
ncbi:ribosomal 50S subunit-recycling heat shock protein [Salsuginibacillus halophilus]|uniref:RQC P-site tRNA stabilizing factor n=1 Tax=Salsuginibacillus halophilus TaxID=517424 RepID=A0A2P8H7T9_9BACI|nr:RNA-binding S4 domain-containing protein [Salsuginibacillus halophilus]PSL42261.1 ribosomal 50S subunit-recycling heat shock protein [Salsuginibacillus halophilus]